MVTLREIAQIVEGSLLGDHEIQISGVASIENAVTGDLTFAKNAKLVSSLADCRASAALVPSDTPKTVLRELKIAIITVGDVTGAFSQMASLFRPSIERPTAGVSAQAYVSPTAQIGENVTIYPGAYVGDESVIGAGTRIFPGVCILEQCVIGNDVTIFPSAVLYENTKVGDGSIIHAGAILGAYGFGYDSSKAGHQRCDQIGNVELGVQVEIGACTTVDRGTFGPTRIDDGTKIDNQVMIGHNCQIGKHNLFCSQVGIAGSCRTGDFVVMAGQVGIGDHLRIGNHVILAAKAGVMNDLKSDQTYVGAPAIPVREQFQILAVQSKLPQMRKQLKQLEKKVADLESSVTTATKTVDAKRAA